MEYMFLSENRGEDILRWAQRIDAIAEALALLSDYDKDHLYDLPPIMNVISEYAMAIKVSVERVSLMIDDYFRNVSLKKDLFDLYKKAYKDGADLYEHEIKRAIKRGEEFLMDASDVETCVKNLKYILGDGNTKGAEHNGGSGEIGGVAAPHEA